MIIKGVMLELLYLGGIVFVVYGVLVLGEAIVRWAWGII